MLSFIEHVYEGIPAINCF